MTSKEALKRLWQETAPATYMKDFDKKECCDIIEKDLEALEALKKHFYEEYQLPTGQHSLLFRINGTPEYKKIKEWLENDK